MSSESTVREPIPLEVSHEQNRIGSLSYWNTAFSHRLDAPGYRNSLDPLPSPSNVLTWDGEIHALTVLLTAAKERRNASAVTGALPAEILSRIFEEVHTVSPMLCDDEHVVRRGWLAVTQVCRIWRAVATAHATLWQNVPVVSVPLWNIFMNNSGDLPLIVDSCLGDQVNSPMLADLHFIQEHFTRIAELKIHAHCTGPMCPVCLLYWDLIKRLNAFTGTVPYLKVLKIETDNARHQGYGLSARFFTRIAVGLQEVTLRNINYPLDAISPQLRSLALDRVDVFDVAKLFDTLRLLPCLARLSLMSSRIPLDSTRETPTELPHLRYLLIKDEIDNCVILWKSLVTHPLAYVEIDSSSSGTYSDIDLFVLSEAISSHVNHSHRPSYTQLDLYADDVCEFLMGLHTESAGSYGETSSTPTLSHPHPSPGLKVVVPILRETSRHDIPNLYQTLLSGITEKEWVVLRLSGDMHWDDGQFLSMFSQALFVRFLTVYQLQQETVLSICTALAALLPDSTPRLFPGLTMLRFEGVDFGCPECPGDRSAISRLTEALTSRAGDTPDECHWHPVSYLNVTSCSVTKQDITKWAEYVPDLRWDCEVGDAHWPHGDEQDELGGESGVDGD